MLRRGETIVQTCDFRYTGSDCQYFIRCCLCQCYTPFIFYVVSRKAIDIIAKYLPANHNFFCANCLPRPSTTGNDADELYLPGSLFNNNEFLSMFYGHEYFNPYYHKYSTKTRLIITETSKVYSNYKDMARKPLPASVKLRKLYQLFPKVHQITFRKYGSMAEMYSELRKKYKTICAAYNRDNDRGFYDNFDFLIQKTPLQPQAEQSRSRASASTNFFPADIYLMRSGQGSEQLSIAETDLNDGSSVQFSSQSFNGERDNQLEFFESQQSVGSVHLSQRDVQHQPASCPIDISSQEVEIGPILPLSESITSVSPNISIASSNSSIALARIRPLQGVSNSQEAGPSGLQQLQQQEEEQDNVRPSRPKRRCTSTAPVNPSPQEAQSSRSSRVRLPRMPGG